MDALFRLKDYAVQEHPGVKILKAPEAAQWMEAQRLLAATRTRCEAMLREAEEEAQRLRLQGYEEGREEGREEYAEKMLETVLSSVEFIESMETRLVDVVSKALRKIVGDFEDDTRIVLVVRQALQAMRQQQRVTLRVAVDDEKPLAEALAPLMQGTPGAGAFLHLLPDPRLPRGSCLLESDMGVVDASLETQLRALERALRAKVR